MTDQSNALATREYEGEEIEHAAGRERLPPAALARPRQQAIATIKQTDDVSQLLPAFARAQMAFPPILKDRIATIEKGNIRYTYKYANLADVQTAVNPVLQANKLSFMMVPTGARIIGRLIHESGQYIEGDLPIVQADSRGGAQALGSALTYAKRYLMSSMLGLVLDDFDDGAAASGGRAAPVAAPRDTGLHSGQAPRPPAVKRAPTAEEIAAMSAAGCEEVIRVASKPPAKPTLRALAYARLIDLSANTSRVEEIRQRFEHDDALGDARVTLRERALVRDEVIIEGGEREPGEDG